MVRIELPVITSIDTPDYVREVGLHRSDPAHTNGSVSIYPECRQNVRTVIHRANVIIVIMSLCPHNSQGSERNVILN